MRLARYPESVEVADRALALAERLNLEEVVAEALVNKGASFDFLGRRRESAALQEAALELARGHGWIALELRVTNNVSGTMIGDDPRRAIEVVRQGLALGLRVGNRPMTAWLAGTLGYYSYHSGGDWDEALAVNDEVLSLSTEPSGL